jgi:hypothetical protein
MDGAGRRKKPGFDGIVVADSVGLWRRVLEVDGH